jgi:hypothetical protein
VILQLSVNLANYFLINIGYIYPYKLYQIILSRRNKHIQLAGNKYSATFHPFKIKIKKLNPMKPIRIITALAFVAIIVIILLADFRVIPKRVFTLYDFPYGDKVGHFFLMGLFSFLVNMSLNMRKVSVFSVSILLGSLIVVILTTVEEFSQSFFPSRTASFFDLAASYLGIFVIGNLSVWIPALKPDNNK